MKWLAVQAIAKDEQSNRRVNFADKRPGVVLLLMEEWLAGNLTHYFASCLTAAESGDNKARAPGLQLCSDVSKKTFSRMLDKNVDLASASKTFAGIEAHERRVTGPQNVQPARGYILFQTPRT